MYAFAILIFSFSFFRLLNAGDSNKPNVVLILADDMGWNDVSYHGSDQIQTPNIDLLAYTGVALQRHYTHPQCTPSRSALLTGKFAHKLGMQGYPLTQAEDRGVSATEKILPQYMKELNYSTHLVGKWHIGHARNEFLPTSRGFDSHYGNRGGFIDAYEYFAEETWPIGKQYGLDLYRDLAADWGAEGHITDLYNEEAKRVINAHDQSKPLFLMVNHVAPHCGNVGAFLQATPEEVRAMRYIEASERRIFAATMKKLDDSIGDIIQTLKQKGILNNTIIVFMSDNGAPTTGISTNFGLNLPMKGSKMTPWEGGIKVPALLWAANLDPASHIYEGYTHNIDLLPTILGAIGADSPEGIDGKNQWNNIKSNLDSERDVIYELDDYSNYSAVISGDYKLLIGNVSVAQSDYLGLNLLGFMSDPPVYEKTLKSSMMYSVLEDMGKIFSYDKETLQLRKGATIDCGNKEVGNCLPDEDTTCLYNIKEDPCEREDLSSANPEIVQRLLEMIRVESETIKIHRVVPMVRDPRGLPRLHNNTWSTFL